MFNKRDEMDAVIERHLESYAVMLETGNYVNREEQRMIYKEITKRIINTITNNLNIFFNFSIFIIIHLI